MKRLILVRNGECGQGGFLSDRGRSRMDALAEKLAPFTSGASTLILTSPTWRTRQSAKILGIAFGGVKIQTHEVLWSDDFNPSKLDEVLQLVKNNQSKADVLVLVTHPDCIGNFTKYLAQKELGVQLPPYPINKGEAWVLDCVQKTLIHVQ